MKHQTIDTYREPIFLGFISAQDGKADDKIRHAAPVHYHLARQGDGTFTLRILAFPSPILPNRTESARVLQDLLDHLKTELPARIAESGPAGRRREGDLRTPPFDGFQFAAHPKVLG